MRKVMMIGLIVALACSCQTPTIKDPVRTYQLSMPREKALSARRNFDIKSDPRTVAERVEENIVLEFNELPRDLMCFSLETYLKKIKPTVREGAQAYYDQKNFFDRTGK